MYVFRGDINAYFYQKNKIKAVSRLFLLLEKGVASLKAFFFSLYSGLYWETQINFIIYLWTLPFTSSRS